MSFKIKLVSAHEIKVEELNSLIKLVFKRELPLEFTIWKYLNYPDGEVYISSAWDRDKLIGIQSIFPLSIQTGKNYFKGKLFMDVGVHPAYRGKGLFKELVENAEDFSWQQGVEFIVTFPNKNSYPLFFRKLKGWKEIDILRFGIGFAPLFCKIKGKFSDSKDVIRFSHTSVWAEWLFRNPLFIKCFRMEGIKFCIREINGMRVLLILGPVSYNITSLIKGSALAKILLMYKVYFMFFLASKNNLLLKEFKKCGIVEKNILRRSFYMVVKCRFENTLCSRILNPDCWDITWEDWDVSWGG